ncbi:MAG: hypothetical protein ABIJ08_05870 [Nanoarchaeota archaeon]
MQIVPNHCIRLSCVNDEEIHEFLKGRPIQDPIYIYREGDVFKYKSYDEENKYVVTWEFRVTSVSMELLFESDQIFDIHLEKI